MKTELDPRSEIDTSRMSSGQRATMELTESAREAAVAERGLAGGLFMGRVNWNTLSPFPTQPIEDRDQGDAFLTRLRAFLKQNADPDEIDRTGEIPDAVMAGLAKLGAFGIKIPMEYGGLGLSQTNYCRAATVLGSFCSNLTALLSAHQSIGVPQPLLLFGTEEQKRRYLPRVAAGEISAFALTETGVGSDPARMETHAEPTPDGRHFILNGEKLWCTNGVRAGVIVVMARTPEKSGKSQITAFIVETGWPGVEVVRRCHFMGLRALYNGVLQFHNVKVPRENILLGEGRGLRVALTTLNTGRLTLPAACAGFTKRCLQISRRWAQERVQWGSAIGHHAAIADKLARMAANAYAMEAMTLYTASRVDRDHQADIRIEAAMAKMWASERAWEAVDETMQIRGGRGYETAQSLAARGEPAIGVERMMRDARINLIFEGSSEIMRLFIAREALDPHLKIGGPVLNTRLPGATRAQAALGAAFFYTGWYPRQWLGATFGSGAGFAPVLRPWASYVERTAHRLARTLFHAMMTYGPKLERRQLLLGRVVDIGTELFAVAASCSRASGENEPHGLELADYFARTARQRIRRRFSEIHNDTDAPGYRLAKPLLDGELSWLEDEVLEA